ncbi:hypothetical protein EXE10_00215 [Acinetobacter sp. WCHAc060033]|uniref:hypothetical protein n=1 Tax=Acinetobacter TaxID=469 RepID=UPI001022C34C|nr:MULTISPECIES: hypothetical protein [Acinetobacter]RZG73555.1 hypothetical protein EXU29_07600 [Acinetobacter wuhouensis]RZG92484.1 hypothetical protein EXE10_00215 [Acinetobacter sp. WCHAc060033]
MDKSTFLQSAIQDTQQNIRAIDFKIGALLAGCIVPFPQIRTIYEFLDSNGLWYQQALAWLIFAIWLVAVLILLAALSAIDNPSKHINDGYAQKGHYYGGGTFKFNLINGFFRTDIRANQTVQNYSDELDKANFPFVKELAFEHLKLIYVRDLKLFRLKFAVVLIACLIVIGSVSFLFTPEAKKVEVQKTMIKLPNTPQQ